MKSILRNFLINLSSIWVTSYLLPGFYLQGGVKTLIISSLVFMLINTIIIPLLKIMFLPLNLLTLGIFSWIINVVGLYLLTSLVSQIKLIPYYFPGVNLNGFTIPAVELNVLYVAIVASFLISTTSHFLQWVVK